MIVKESNIFKVRAPNKEFVVDIFLLKSLNKIVLSNPQLAINVNKLTMVIEKDKLPKLIGPINLAIKDIIII